MSVQSADCRDQGGDACFPQGVEESGRVGSLVPGQMLTGPGEETPGNQQALDKCLLKNRCIAKCHKVG